MLSGFKRALLLFAFPCVLGVSFAACSGGLKAVDEVNNPADDKALSECRANARAENLIYGDPDRAYALYLECTRDAGLR